MSKYKKLVLDHLEPFRSKELSFGCEYLYDNQHHVVIQTNDDGWIQPFGYDDCHFAHHKTEDQIKIIGHPITHADLLQALHNHLPKDEGWVNNYYTNGRKQLTFTGNPELDNRPKFPLDIPLNYRNIEDIPEDDPCWEQLCKVFNLT